MKCKKCGKLLPDGKKYCRYCGAKAKKKTGLIIGITAVAMAVVTAVTAITIIKIKPDTDSIKTNSSASEEVYFRELDPDDVVMDLGCMGYVDNELLITAELGTERSVIEDIAEKYSADIVGEIPLCCDYQLMFSEKLPKERLEAIAAEVNEMEGVMYADLNRVTYSSGMDTKYKYDIGSDWPDDDLSRWGFNAVNTNGAWELLKNNEEIVEPVKVGIVDTGFYMSNPDLCFAEEPYNNVGHYHGTGCAGVFAANGNNKFGICGIYPYGEGNLYGASEIGTTASSNQNIKYKNAVSDKLCFQYVIKSGAKVINYSFGDWYCAGAIELFDDTNLKNDFAALSRSVASTLINLRQSGYDFLIVAASGNISEEKYLRLIENNDGNYAVDNENGDIYGRIGGNVNQDNNDKKYYFKHEEGCSQCANNSFKGHQIKKVKDSDMRSMSSMPSKYTSYINCICSDIAPKGQEEKYTELRSRIITVGAVVFPFDESNFANQQNAGADEYDCFRSSTMHTYSPNVLSSIYFSNVGEIYAPGAVIRNTTENDYGYSSGTSEAAPIVAGIAAMIWSADNDLRGDQVRAILLNNKVPTAEEDVYIPDAEAAVRQALRSNPDYYYPGADDSSKYEWELQPTIEAEDIIVYNIEEIGFDHSIFNDLAYIKQNSNYGIIDYSGSFLAECTTPGYLTIAPILNQLSAGGLILGSGNGSFVEYDQTGGVGGGYVYCFYSKKDGTVYVCNGIDGYGDYHKLNEYDYKEMYPVRLAEFTELGDSKYEIIQESIGTGWGIAKGDQLIVDCEYDAVILPNFGTTNNNFVYYDICALRKDGKWCYVDGNGNTLTDFDFSGFVAMPPADTSANFALWGEDNELPYLPTEGLIAVKTDAGAGYIDTSGNVVIAPGTFAETRPVHNGLAWVKHKSSGLWGVIRVFEADSSNTAVTTETPAAHQDYMPEISSSYFGLWHGNAYYGDGRNVTDEMLSGVREYYEQDITIDEFVEIDIRSDGTAKVYQIKRVKTYDCKWRADGNSIVLIDPDGKGDDMVLEMKDERTLKLTWDDDDKYILLKK